MARLSPLRVVGPGANSGIAGRVVQRQAAVEKQKQLLDVTVAERIAQIPGGRYRETACGISDAAKWRPLKSSLDRRFSRSAIALRIMGLPEREGCTAETPTPTSAGFADDI